MMWGYGGWGFWWMLALGVAVTLIVLTAVRSGSSAPNRRDSAIEILEERYARGEIDDDELKARRSQLEAGKSRKR